MPEIIINQFNGGISDDVRERISNKFSISKHFDIFSNPKRLTPYRSVETDQVTNGKIGNFLYSSTGVLLGLGVVSGQDWPNIYKKDGSGLITDAWNASGQTANWVGTKGTTQYNTFIEYKGYVYFWLSGYLNRIDITGSVAMDEYWKTVAHTYTAQGIVHSKNDILFLPYDNKIATLDNTSWTAAALTLPSNFVINAVCEYGNYLAIGCYDLNGGNSKVFLWDMIVSTVTETIDFGRDTLYVLNNLEGSLISVSATPSNIFTLETAKVTLQRWSGGTKPVVIKELMAEKLGSSAPSVTIYPRVNFIKNNRLYFSAKITGGSSPSPTHCGIWAIGRKGENYEYAVTLDRFATNDNSEDGIYAAILLGDICWMNHTALGTVTRTDDQNAYVATSIYESQKFDCGDADLRKGLLKVAASFVALPANATLTVKYRKDEETSWTTIFTESTTSAVSHRAVNIEATGACLPDFNEIQFRIESYKKAELTMFKFEYELREI